MDLNRRKARVAWEEVYLPKKEGGLGFMCSKEWNKDAMTKHLWNLCKKSNHSLWVKWSKTFRLKGRSLWDMKASGNSPWNGKKILKMKDFIRGRIEVIISNSEKTLF